MEIKLDPDELENTDRIGLARGPFVQVLPDSVLDFGSQSRRIIVITNRGDEALNVTNVTIVPSAEFSLANPLNTPFTLKSGLTERFSINFEASSSSASAVLQIASNTTGGTVQEITLQGPALAPQDQNSRLSSTVEIQQDPHTDFSHLSLRLEQTSAQPVPYRLKIVGKE